MEIDVVGVRKHRYVLLGSCKWRRCADVDVLSDLLRQMDALGPQAADAKLAIFAREGFTDALRMRAAEHDALLLSAADLFAG
jgi:uncharacterized protein